ncbi:MAG: hypothetical protein STSR0008_21830 [Ignavibacterium sp.]
MKKNLKYTFCIFLTSFIIFYGCEDRSDLTTPNITPDTGNADFTRYVALGNSLTAGVQSGALYQNGQIYSYAALIAKQVNTSFEIPLISDPGLPSGANGRIEVVSIDPFITTINSSMGQPINSFYPKPYNNLGVPGAFVYDILNATNKDNCYSALFAQTPNPLFDIILRGNGSEFTQAKLQQPTFITLWIGNNDVLGFGTSGGTLPYTPIPIFTALYSQLIDSIKTLNAKAVIANIPDVSAIPFFTTVGDQLRAQGISTIWGTDYNNKVIPMNLSSTLITLTASELLYDENGNPTMIGLTQENPFPNNVLLDSVEISVIQNVVNNYNTTISNLVSNEDNFVLVDIHSLLNFYRANDLYGGIETNGIRFSTTFVSGGMFSLDGVHLTNQGYALVANEFIKKINEKFSAKIPLINVASIPGSLVLSNITGLIKFKKNTFNKIIF